jgi:hypothetical protein
MTPLWLQWISLTWEPPPVLICCQLNLMESRHVQYLSNERAPTTRPFPALPRAKHYTVTPVRFISAVITTAPLKLPLHISERAISVVFRWLLIASLLALCAIPAGCRRTVQKALGKSTWQQKFHWKAEDYFDDVQVVALCHAIEKDDVAEMDRLIAAGTNVNAKGKGNMTPLMWAFPDNKLARFERLLEHGADPNVIIESDFGTRDAIMPGVAVTHMATETSFPGYFEAVFAHGGDPKLAKQTVALGRGDTPIFVVLESRSPNKKNRVQFLLDQGVDIDLPDGGGASPLLSAATLGQYDIAMMLLERGADHTLYCNDGLMRLVHILLRERSKPSYASWSTVQKKDYQQLCEWLQSHGESFEQAEADLKRWKSWHEMPGGFGPKRLAEIAERKAREAQANQKPAPPPADEKQPQ